MYLNGALTFGRKAACACLTSSAAICSFSPACWKLDACAVARRSASSSVSRLTFWGVWLPSETGAAVDPRGGVAAGVIDGPGTFGIAKGVDCGSGVALGEGATHGVLAGKGDCVDGVFGPVEAGGVCARRSPPPQDSTTSAESKRTPVFDVFRIVSFENVEYTDVPVNRKPKESKSS